MRVCAPVSGPNEPDLQLSMCPTNSRGPLGKSLPSTLRVYFLPHQDNVEDNLFTVRLFRGLKKEASFKEIFKAQFIRLPTWKLLKKSGVAIFR